MQFTNDTRPFVTLNTVGCNRKNAGIDLISFPLLLNIVLDFIYHTLIGSKNYHSFNKCVANLESIIL